MHHAHRLVAWQRNVLYGAGAALLASGVAWLLLHYGRAGDTLPSALEPWAMRLHGLAAFAALFAFGTLAAAHVPPGWRFSHRMRWARQRGSGVALGVLAAALAATGYLLYYFAPEPIRPTLGWLHSALGAAMAIVVASHRRRGSRRSAAAAEPHQGRRRRGAVHDRPAGDDIAAGMGRK